MVPGSMVLDYVFEAIPYNVFDISDKAIVPRSAVV
jgi:hypothetical protein